MVHCAAGDPVWGSVRSQMAPACLGCSPGACGCRGSGAVGLSWPVWMAGRMPAAAAGEASGGIGGAMAPEAWRLLTLDRGHERGVLITGSMDSNQSDTSFQQVAKCERLYEPTVTTPACTAMCSQPSPVENLLPAASSELLSPHVITVLTSPAKHCNQPTSHNQPRTGHNLMAPPIISVRASSNGRVF